MQTKRLNDFILFNFLAKDVANLQDIIVAGKGYILPGITAQDYEIEDAVQTINEFKKVVDVVSVGLGGNGNKDNWKKALQIAVLSEAGHLNQPFENASYAMGYLEGKSKNQWVNALVAPSGKVGTVRLGSGREINTELFVELVKVFGIPSIKLMPVKGLAHLDELIDLTRIAAKKDIQAVEPAGGITEDNIKEIVDGVKNTGIELFIPHIFGSTIHPITKETIPEKVATIIKKASE
ncbi:KDGP aldolase [Shimazuella kribbensis]|uniref:KDGP aldolase n=1 Tax=Shimazuella kribbensis TaxID=139808 RepID=UPI000418F685|nr:KDGP aldolase [Shimazuella kribbensis]